MRPQLSDPARRILWALLPQVVLLWGLRHALPSLSSGLWGPEDPWSNGDLVGAWWLWWAFDRQRAGLPGFALLEHPQGWEGLRGVFPNPGDIWLLSHLGPPSALAWNLAQLAHLSLLLIAAYLLALRAQASPMSAAAGVSLVAASPVVLHEVAGGRPATLIAWPAVFCLAAMLRPDWLSQARAGAWAALQGVAYAFQGLSLGIVALPLLRSARGALLSAGVGLLLFLPYVLWLSQGDLPTDRPPAGYTALPLAGLLGLESVPPRFRLHPVFALAALALGWRAPRRFVVAAALALLISLGPLWTWAMGEQGVSGPWAWVAWALPLARRLHHPVRSTLLLLPLMAVLVALGLDRSRWGRVGALVLVLAALANQQAMRETTAWDRPVRPPFADLKVPEGPLVDVLGMPHRGALALQTLHAQPILETAWNRRPDTPTQQAVERLSQGLAPEPQLWSSLRAQGYRSVLVLDRGHSPDPERTRALVEQALGPPVAEGVYSLGP